MVRTLVLCSALVGAAMGCNQLLGLDKAAESPPDDARFFDAPIDAPFACPPIGTAPQFSALLHQDVNQDCSSYSVSTSSGIAIGLCANYETVNLRAVYQGSIDQPMLLRSEFSVPSSDEVNDVKLSPEGDTVFAVVYHTQSLSYDIRTYDRIGDVWTRGPDVAASVPSYVQITSVSRLPDRHLIQTGSDGQLHELVESGAVWTERTSYSAAELGVMGFDGVTMSGDGLRLLVIVPDGVRNRVMYTDRASLDGRFRTAEPLVVPAVRNLFITEDCSRVYVTGLTSIFHLQQL